MLSRIALMLIALIAMPYYWLLVDPGPTSAPLRAIDLARLRAEAGRYGGARPTGIEYAAVATQTRPGTLLVAGGGLKADMTAVVAWRLITPGGDTVINAGLTMDQAEASGFGSYHPEVQDAVDRWLYSARRILFTSEDIDHIGGLAKSMALGRGLASKLVTNDAQARTITDLQPVFASALAPPLAALSEASGSGPSGYAGVAPGIAVVRTPGHLPGAQMIYVRLQNGREYLFAGDTAPMRRNVSWMRPRSRYMAEWQGSEDRAATTGWLKGLAQLQTREPRLTLVYAHDLGWLLDPDHGPRFAAVKPAQGGPKSGQPVP
jgi:glyoxylase-like metal-dependent hydrolase (beta-lactamase superfamily II)